MRVDGVNFVESACVPMGKDKFVAEMSESFFLDIPERDRKKKLADIYDLMSPPKAGKKSASKKEDNK